MADIRLRNYQHADVKDLNRIAVAAFDNFRGVYHNRSAVRVMSFVEAHDAPPIFGVAYAVYTKAL